MGRAAAHGLSEVTRFSDPTALALLPDESRAFIEAYRAGKPPSSLRGRFGHMLLPTLSVVTVARTLAIDDAIAAAAAPQLVILGAGLDGRGWRMPELRDTLVFEVDHPDTQRDKRARCAQLTATAREIRFVPVDFTRDSLDTALQAAGHDANRLTTWVWEGVVMYLTLAEIKASLAVIARRSAAGSTLALLYGFPSPLSRVIAVIVNRLGEPFRSRFSVEQMRTLLNEHGFLAREDRDIATIGRTLGAALANKVRWFKHLRLVVASRV
jgi:methyltransferase (TIGR00027 family)